MRYFRDLNGLKTFRASPDSNPGTLRHPKHLELEEVREVLRSSEFRCTGDSLRKVSYWVAFESKEHAALWIGANFFLSAVLAAQPERKYQWAKEVTDHYVELGEKGVINYPRSGSRRAGEVYLEKRSIRCKF